MRRLPSSTSGIRLAELVAALSIATDLGMGQPMEYVLRSCAVSVRLGEALALSVGELREVYYLALLRFLGCNAETPELDRLPILSYLVAQMLDVHDLYSGACDV